MENINQSTEHAKSIRFSGLKLVVIESQGTYYRSVFAAAVVGLSHLMIGATLMASIIYSIHVGDIHAALCTAYHCLMAQGILSHNYFNGWSTHLRSSDRTMAHAILQIIGIICAAFGTISTLLSTSMTTNTHCITGAIAYVLTFICLVSGLGVLIMDAMAKTVHMVIGLATFFMTASCLISGFFMKDFQYWANNTVVYILVSFVIFHTSCILSSIIMKRLFLKWNQ